MIFEGAIYHEGSALCHQKRGGAEESAILNQALKFLSSIFRDVQIIGLTGENVIKLRFGENELPFIPLNKISDDVFDKVVAWSGENLIEILNKLKENISNFHEEKLLTVANILNPNFLINVRNNLPYKVMKETLQYAIFNDKPREFELKVRNIREYGDLLMSHAESVTYSNAISHMYAKMPGKVGYYPGYCSACQKEQNFFISPLYSGVGCNSGKGDIVWRETASCPYCGCNSRMRHIVQRILNSKISFNDKIYINEKISPVYRALSKFFPNIIGSEYLGSDKIGGNIYNGIRHEDAMNLSFSDESFDIVVSCDVFEHVADCYKGFKETCRVLKTGGKFIFTVPIFIYKAKTLVRASIDANGELVYHEKPVYHGNPMDPQGGSLVFYDYGWDVLDILKECGFRDACLVFYFSADKAYFGEPFSFSIEAVK